MKRRIALVTSDLENISQQRIMSGVFSQCAKYGYDVAVIAPMVNTSHFMTEDLQGELNIFNLINFDLFDGVIITPSHMFGNDVKVLQAKVLKMFREKCHCKVVAINLPFGDYETVFTDEVSAFYEITKHVYEEHWRKKVFFLNGTKGYNVSEQRLAGFLKYTNEKGITIPEDHIFYGEFWYNNGERLAEDIASGAVEMPDAVICASDHIAIGLANRLVKLGIQVPGQIVVTGYDTTQEAALNDIYITSYEPQEREVAARAVNCIHRCLDPEEAELPTEDANDRAGKIRTGESCGCTTDTLYIKRIMSDALLHQKPNWSEIHAGKPIDINVLLESYLSESVMNAKDVINCIDQIYHHVNLLRPYREYWICLKDNWLDMTDVVIEGYCDRMRIVLHSDGATDMGPAVSPGFCDEIGERSFDTAEMLPEMLTNEGEPSVFYFNPVHVGPEMLGYTVMKCPLTQEHKLGYVYHNWIRIISNALSVIRLKNELSELSMRDHVTGLRNRRGMLDWLKWQMGRQGSIYVIMTDMDGLKFINDHFGHSEGDYGLITIAETLSDSVNDDEICARVGGDEFLIIGVGDYDEEYIKNKIRVISDKLDKVTQESGKPYEIAASMGYCVETMSSTIDFERILENADVDMYRNKKRRRS